MKTIFGLDTADENHVAAFVTPEKVEESIQKAIAWLEKAQAANGGWGSGSHYKQHVLDPHAVETDPATTALVCMALLRNEGGWDNGNSAPSIHKATLYLLNAVESCPENQLYITKLTNTQPQTKLGRNIDVILTAQYFSNLLHYDLKDEEFKKRIEKALDKCVAKIQKQQDENGGWRDGGWAPVLQSALAHNALESAQEAGRSVDQHALNKSRDYQNSHFDAQTLSVKTSDAAGVALYGISSTARANSKQARKTKEIIQKAQKEGKITTPDVTIENLQKAGVDVLESKQLATAYSVNKAAEQESVKEEVMIGFGSNGGEEFLSYLMTGESVFMKGGNEWKKWYDMMSKRLIQIQNNNGSWNGHHCITSPVFCTATCILVLSIHKDIQMTRQLIKSIKE
ncbi:MAG: hypothetical protein N2747_02745 [Chitinophagaceae bacterium]|nr:hypothetical protein [Chitinophagaceae bacterium]